MEHLRGWVHAVAYDRTRSQPHMLEDAFQEGLIAAWEAWQHRPGNSEYAKGAARNAIIGYATGHRKPYGHAGHRGWQEAKTVDIPPADVPEPSVPPRASDLAYHRREIRTAMADFTPRQMRVAGKVAFGIPLTSAGGERSEWYMRLKPRLADRLSHLRGVA